MHLKHIAIGLCLALLTVPGAVAHGPAAEADDEGPLGWCSGSVDYLCRHADCSTNICVILWCPVYMSHAGHSGALFFGCS